MLESFSYQYRRNFAPFVRFYARLMFEIMQKCFRGNNGNDFWRKRKLGWEALSKNIFYGLNWFEPIQARSSIRCARGKAAPQCLMKANMLRFSHKKGFECVSSRIFFGISMICAKNVFEYLARIFQGMEKLHSKRYEIHLIQNTCHRLTAGGLIYWNLVDWLEFILKQF